jgi:hypothetical protein
MPDDTWVTAWKENTYYYADEESTLQVIDGEVISFYLSQDEYFKSAQVMFETLDSSIEVPMRAVWYGLDGSIVVGANDVPLVDEFIFTVAGTGATSACVDKVVTYNDAARDYQVVFDSLNEEEFWFEIPAALTTVAEAEGCEAVFKVYVQDSNSEEWHSWDQMVSTVKTHLTHSEVTVSSKSEDYGSVYVTIHKTDIEYLQTLIVPGSDGSMKLNLLVAALVPGFALAGATTGLENLVQGQFSVTIYDYTKISACAGNVLWVGDQTESSPKQPREN